VGKEDWIRASPFLQKEIHEEDIPMLNKTDVSIASINTLWIYAYVGDGHNRIHHGSINKKI
jgi:hypothetical protein